MKKRILKFRVWSNLLKKFAVDTEFSHVYQDEDFSTGTFWIGGDDCEIQQFTGLLDSKGNEIYEGDIVKYCEHVAVIEFFTDNGCYILANPNFPHYRHDLYIYGNETREYKIGTTKMQILGNIFENPELLNTK